MKMPPTPVSSPENHEFGRVTLSIASFAIVGIVIIAPVYFIVRTMEGASDSPSWNAVNSLSALWASAIAGATAILVGGPLMVKLNRLRTEVDLLKRRVIDVESSLSNDGMRAG